MIDFVLMHESVYAEFFRAAALNTREPALVVLAVDEKALLNTSNLRHILRLASRLTRFA